MVKPSWFVDRAKESAVQKVKDADVKNDRLPNVLMGPLWLLVGYVLKRAGAHICFPINEERLIVLFGREEVGLIKNFQSEGRLYDPIIVDDSAFTKWVVANREALILTAEEFQEERVSLADILNTNPESDWDPSEVCCYFAGDPPEPEDDSEMIRMCYFAGDPPKRG